MTRTTSPTDHGYDDHAAQTDHLLPSPTDALRTVIAAYELGDRLNLYRAIVQYHAVVPPSFMGDYGMVLSPIGVLWEVTSFADGRVFLHGAGFPDAPQWCITIDLPTLARWEVASDAV